jgi:uncharacterized repeat protein (TIGR01451 family)
MKTKHLLIPFALALALGLILLWLLGHRAVPATAGPVQRAVERPAERPLPDIRPVIPTGDDGSDRRGRNTPCQAIQHTQAQASGGNVIEAATSGLFCEPMSPPSGNVIEVDPSQASELDSTIQAAATGDTILLRDGTYELHGDYLWFSTPGVTMRSASGNREAVVIDGNYETTEMVTVNASSVTIADLTLRRAQTHPIHVTPPHDAHITATLIYNVHIIDPGEQAIKINQNGNQFPDNGVVACSHIEMTDEGRSHVSGCYTGGVDAHRAWGWMIRDNVIEGFWCQNGLSEHAIHFWTGSRDTIVERNVLIDDARGVGFGLGQSGSNWRVYPDGPCPGADYVGHFDGIIRNNFIFAGRDALFSSQYGFDCGICLEQACGTQVLHNTVASTQSPFSSIEWRWPNTDAEITNNLVSHNLRERDGASASLAGNLEDAPLSLFVDGTGGDLHLTEGASSAIGQGVNAGVTTDIDGQTRDSAPDIGADEYGGVYLSSSRKTVNPEEAGTGEVLTYTVVLYNTGIFSATDTTLFDAIPAHTTYVPNSACATSGVTTDTGGIGWMGTVTLNESVTITFRVTVNEQALIENRAVVTDQYGTPTILTAWVNARHTYLPVVLQQYP